MNFIKTTDVETSNQLRALGLQEITKEGNFFVFINQDSTKLNFDTTKVVLTDKLYM